jgi:hypothetical protein
MTNIAFTYNKEKNGRKAFIPGVPLRDLTVAKFESLSEAQKVAVEHSEFYQRYTKKRKPKPVAVEDDSGEAGADLQGVEK